ncbi:hypothetical protein Vretimale_8538, partial [Volvox reticuliferus]
MDRVEVSWRSPTQEISHVGAPSHLAIVQPAPTASPAPQATLPPIKRQPAEIASPTAAADSADGALLACSSTPARPDPQPAECDDAVMAEAGASCAEPAISMEPQFQNSPEAAPTAEDYRPSAPGNARDSSPQQPAAECEDTHGGASREESRGCAATGMSIDIYEEDGRATAELQDAVEDEETAIAEPMYSSPPDQRPQPAATDAVAAAAGTLESEDRCQAEALPQGPPATSVAFNATAAAVDKMEGAVMGGVTGGEDAGNDDALPRPSKRRRMGSSNGAMMKELKGLLESSMYDAPSGRSRQGSRAAS